MPKRVKTEYIKQKNLKTFRVIILTALFSVFSVFLSSSSFEQDGIENAPILIPNAASVHSPIYIDGNSALDAFCSGNGTTGADWGSAHVIENYEIDAGFSGSGIEIRNTDRYLIIRNMTSSNSGSGTYDSGIYLDNSTNVKIINTTNNDNKNAIALKNSNYNNLTGNVGGNTSNGYYIVNSNNNVFTGSNPSNNNNGFHLSSSDNNYFSGNNASGNNIGFRLVSGSNNNTILGNEASNNTLYGFYITGSINNVLSGNNASLNDRGFYLLSSGNYNNTEDNPFEGFSPAAIGALAGGIGLIPIIKALRSKRKKKNKSLNFNGKEKKKKKKKKKKDKKKYVWDLEPGFLD